VACGLFMVCSGQVRLSTQSSNGRAILLKFVHAGDLSGLTAILSGKSYKATAEVSEPDQINFIPRAAFLRFLQANPEAVIHVAQLLADSHYAPHEIIETLGLSSSTFEKLARFLLGWFANHARGQDQVRIAITHEEIGSMIGVSRETLTRLLTAFKKRNLLAVTGTAVNICNGVAVQTLAGI